MSSLDLLFYRKLRERIAEEKEARKEVISTGGNTSFEDYKQSVGYIRALNDSLIWASEINDQLVGKDTQGR
jgi:hypothetical protein